MDGSNLRLRESTAVTTCSPDGTFVVYVDVAGDVTRLMKVGIDGGTPTEISKAEEFSPVISPDGGSVAVLINQTLPNIQV